MEARTPVETFVLGSQMVELEREDGRGIEIVVEGAERERNFAEQLAEEEDESKK